MALYRNEEIQLWIIGVFVISALIKIVYSVSPTPYMLPVLTAVPPLSSQIRETVMIPVSDSEIEANKLYEEHLKSYGITEKAIRKICPPWEAKGCQCTTDKEQDEAIDLTCRGVFFSNFQTLKWPRMLVKLQLTNNNITTLPSRSFDLPHLNELVLSYNSLHNIDVDAFVGLKSMTRLVMNNCELTRIPGKALSRIPGLNILQMNGNSINLLEPECSVSFKQLKNLYLEGNSMTKIPTKTLMELTSLETLNLGSNHLRNIEMGDFPVMKNLVVLLLKRNHLTEIPSGSLLNLTSLNVIDLDDNQLTSLPPDLVKLYHLQELFVSGNRIKFILKDDLPKSLTIIEMRTNPLIEFKTDSMINMKKLKKLTLSNSRSLETLPSFSGCESLEILWVDRSKLKELPHNLCQTSPRLKALELKSNRLTSVPELAGCRQLRLLDLAGNKIDSLYGNPFQTLVFLQDLLLSYNQIATIPYDAFLDLSSLQLLDLEGNNINFIHKDAFVTLIQLKDLNLGNNIFPDLPTTGLMSLNHLKTFNNPRLKEFPTTESFPKIETLVLSYAYHCCAFLPLKVRALETKVATVTETILPLPEGVNFSSLLNDSSLRDIMLRNGFEYPTFYGTIPTYEEYNEVEITRSIKSETLTIPIRCLPLPDPFLPCQDLFDWWTLRCGVWVVFLLAMLGNGTVVFVLIFSRSKMDVPRFLVCNLAAADFFMGVYLGLLAVVDASTLGEFRMYAIPWQMSAGCQLAGFLAVLSSELSVYTLAVITLERNYAITHAMHLNKRLSLRHAAYIMTIGWMFALTMAMLPLFGISDYRKFAVCLPFETTTGPGSLAYVIFLMFINGVAFLILMGCYLKMYCAIRGSQAWNSNDSRIAKRMALLVFTDFLCWSPIAFFSLTAVFGLHLISLEQAKVFTVFVLPLNSCCNPFLYAILTKQFKKDCVLICKAIEESRVTRGIGRCRHSSNFSNRQTPANTNSLVERSSRDLPPLIPGQTCACAKLLEQDKAHRHTNQPGGFSNIWRRLLCHAKQNDTRRGKRSDQYAHQIAEIQQKQHKRAGSMSSSENFSSSRSDSWRHGPPHHYCGIQLRKLDPRWRHSSWLITRKTSQDSNLSSSRNDSSGSATTASTSTWRMSRSSAGASTPLPPGGTSFSSTIARQSLPGSKPRLVRQSAIHDDSLDLSSSPPRLGVRFLPTIPSAADSSVQLDEDTVTNNDNNGNDDVGDVGDVVGGVVSGGTQYYAVLQSGNPLTTLSSPKDKTKPP